MKVIKKGKRQGWTKRVTCTGNGNGGFGCGAILEVCEEDLFSTGRSFMDGSTETYTTIRCCACEKLTDLRDSDHPTCTLPTMQAWYNTRDLELPKD